MKKVMLSLAVVAAFVLYSWYARKEQGAPPPIVASASTPAPTNQDYKNGAYTGGAADAVYGDIQVRVVIRGKRITDVVFLQYPKDSRASILINQEAMPYLKQEAIQTQSAQVDGVSGATDTSAAFIESLSSALDKAKL